jgi:hypothetical protein
LVKSTKREGYGPDRDRAGKASQKGEADLPEHDQVSQEPNEVRELVDQNITSWKHVGIWLRRIELLVRA